MRGESARYGQLLQTSRHLRVGPVELTLPLKHRTLSAAGRVKHGPVIDGDLVYATSNESSGWSVRCIDLNSGELVWHRLFPDHPDDTDEGELVLAEGVLLVSIRQGVLVLDSSNGQLRAEWLPGVEVQLRRAALCGSTCYMNREVVNDTGGVCAFDLQSGAVLWETGHSAGLAATLIAANGEFVLFTSSSETLACLDSTSGQHRWQLDVSELGRHVPVSDRWQKKPESVTGYVSGPLMLLDQEVVVKLGGWGLLGVDYAAGKPVWEVNDDTFLGILPYTAAECVVVTRDSRFLEFDFKARRVEREYSSEVAERELHVWGIYGRVAEKALVLTSPRASHIGVFSREDGRLLWKHDLGGRAEEVILMPNRLFVRDESGRLNLFESA